MPGGEIRDFQPYSGWVLAVGLALVLAAAAWLAWVIWTTSAARERRRASAPVEMRDETRMRYLAEVDEHYAAYQAGALDLRALHLELASTTRAFVSERIGRDVRSWTVRDISSHDPTSRAGGLLRAFEEPSFARRSDAEAVRARDGAREVISRW